MIDPNLDIDEAIILESDRVTWADKTGIQLRQLTLTNKYIYIYYTKNLGHFIPPIDEMIQNPLSDIKIINGQPMVDQVKNNFGTCLQIQFIQGRELFVFNENTKKTTFTWVNELHKLLVGAEAPSEKKIDAFSGLPGLGGIASNLKTVAGAAIQSVSSSAKQVANQASGSFGNTIQQAQESRTDTLHSAIPKSFIPESRIAYCINCGKKIEEGASFCAGCGKAIDEPSSSLPAGVAPVMSGSTTPETGRKEQNPIRVGMPKILAGIGIPPIPKNTDDSQSIWQNAKNPTTRRQEFAGYILKCPNCGAVINQSTVRCPECDHRITGQAPVNSVSTFNEKLMMLEAKRKRAGLIQLLGETVDPVDNQKLSLIRSFPIPNTIDDIQEFMLLAMANIDVGLSKNTWGNRHQSSSKVEENCHTIAKTISDAWVAKMKQAYQKAAVLFPNDPAFSYVRQLYVNKMTELKMKVDY